MKYVKEHVDHISEELDGAMEYAENFVVYRNTNPQWAQMYHDMAVQELSHAENLRVIAQEAMDKVSYIPEGDAEMWKDKQRQHAEKKAMIRLLLSK